MNSEGLWAIGILALIPYGVYRLWKRSKRIMEENMKKAAAMEWKCNHVDEPNHDRIACYNSQSTPSIILILGIMWLFSKC
jgi:hypothetical protein